MEIKSPNSQMINYSSRNDESNAVIIPIDPEMLVRAHLTVNGTEPGNSTYGNTKLGNNSVLPNMEILGSDNQWETTPKLHGNDGNNTNTDKQNSNNCNVNRLHDNNGNNVHNNSNGNGNTNNPDSNPENNNNNTFPRYSDDYSQSPFNPLAMTPPTTTEINTPHIINDENSAETLSLATNQFSLFVNETLKRVCSDKSLKSRLIVPNAQEGNNSNRKNDKSARWGLKIFGPRADLVQEAKREIMRSPAFSNSREHYQEEFDSIDLEDDFEAGLQASRSVESVLLEDDTESSIMTTSTLTCDNSDDQQTKIQSPCTTMSFPTITNLASLLLGPKYNVIKNCLTKFGCNITWEGSLAFQSSDSRMSFEVSGADATSVSSAIDYLKSRSDRINEQAVEVTTLTIEAGKLDWIYSSGTIKAVEEVLWSSGASLTQMGGSSVYQVACLSASLLSACLKKLHLVLSGYQSAHFTFRFRNDYRDFSSKCAGVFDSLAQSCDCTISQKSTEGTVEVELGAAPANLSRALKLLDTLHSQIFEGFDLKLTERRVRIHAPADIRDFISGKKDGKINRIVKETGVNISLNLIGGDSMYVDLVLDSVRGVCDFGSLALLHALSLLEGELPSELTFHVPEVHHKRMIGHGGKVIQRIMKKWGVYVKFMNSHETSLCHFLADPLEVGDSTPRMLDNVIVRTPSKNASALLAIKDEIFEECSISETNDQFDMAAFRHLKRSQDSCKTRITIRLQDSIVRKALCFMEEREETQVECHLRFGALVLEGSKEAISEAINDLSGELRDELVVIDSPPMDGSSCSYTTATTTTTSSPSRSPSTTSSFASSSPCLSEESFKFFPSALFVVQCQQTSMSASNSPIISSPSSSIAMNSINSSPPLPVGHQKSVFLMTDEVNSALAETRRRSADIF
jgi:hypothetical protein